MKSKTKKLIDTENILMVARGRGGVEGRGRMDEGGQQIQTSSYKINKSWGYKAQYCNYINAVVHIWKLLRE